MKQLYLFSLSWILMVQGFGNDSLFEEKEVENFTGSVILAPDEAGTKSGQAQKILSLNIEKAHCRYLISDNESDEDDDDYDDDQDDVSFEYDQTQDEDLLSLPLSNDAQAIPKSQKRTSAQEIRSYGIPDLPPQPTPESQAVAPAPRHEKNTSKASNSPTPAKAQGSPQKRPSQHIQPEKASAQAEDGASQYPARTTPRQRAYHLASAKNTREQGRLQAQSAGTKMGTPYTQKINQSSMQPSGPKDASASNLPQAINLPARPVVKDGWNLWILGEALLWQAVQENMDYIYKGHDESNSRIRDIKKPNFDWDWGWRFGAGYNIPRDGWDLALIWTHIENRAHGSTHRGDEVLYNVWAVASHADDVVGSREAKAHWQVHLDQVDLGLGRQFYVGRHLTLRPNAGMRSAWIFQDYDIHFEGENGTQKTHMTNKFWGMGFFAGLDSDWLLGKGFSLFGDAGFALLLGCFEVDQHGTFNGPTTSKISESFRTGRPIFDLDLGLKWAKKIYNDRFAIAFKVGYEYHLYFDQNQFLLSNGNDTFEVFSPVNGDLAYQGVTFSGRFDF